LSPQGFAMTESADRRSCESSPLFVNDRVLQALRIQVGILEARAQPRRSEDLEPLFLKVEALLRDLVREAGAA
jgi:hypothetical protein